VPSGPPSATRFIDYFIKLKEFEIGRFLSDVTDWGAAGVF